MAYRKIYFRIHTECYSSGWSSDTDRAAFKEESRRLFQELGWTVKLGCNGGCDTVSKDRQDLYLHPSSFSGVMDEANTEALQEKLTQARTFYCYHIDRYEEYRDLSDEGYRAELETKRDEIIAYILKRCRTKRSNLYIVDPIAAHVAEHFKVHHLCDRHGNNKIGNQFVSELMDELLQKGWLVSGKMTHGDGIRTATNKERGIARQPAAQVDRQITIRSQENGAPPKKKGRKPSAPSL